jgi:hypothetical protein
MYLPVVFSVNQSIVSVGELDNIHSSCVPQKKKSLAVPKLPHTLNQTEYVHFRLSAAEDVQVARVNLEELVLSNRQELSISYPLAADAIDVEGNKAIYAIIAELVRYAFVPSPI